MTANETETGAAVVCDALVDAGIDLLIGLPGVQTLPLDRIIAERKDISYVMARHETAIPHTAWGYFEACGRPAATLTVPGPGDTNAMHGLKNALEDGVPIIHIAADVNPEDRGKGPIHEIESDTFDNVVKANYAIERGVELGPAIAAGITKALTPPFGPVRFGISRRILADPVDTPRTTIEPALVEHDNDAAYAAATDLLAGAERPVLYFGGGLRRSPGGPAAARELASALDAPVVCSYKGKGTLPDDDPRFLGVTGTHLPEATCGVLERSDVVLALGADFDGVNTRNWSLPFGKALIEVNVDSRSIGRSYDTTVGIVADAGKAARELTDRLDGSELSTWNGTAIATAARAAYERSLTEQGFLKDSTPVRSAALLKVVADRVPDDTIVTTDIGGFRLWSLQRFPTDDPTSFISPGSWAGMGTGLPAAIGAKLARPDRSVLALCGDGGFMMNLQECHTAADYELDITVVLSNNNDYGVISKSPDLADLELDGNRFAWRSPDFPAIVEGFGWSGFRAADTDELGTCIEAALETAGPSLVDVAVQTDEPTAAAAADFTDRDDPFA